MNAAPAIGAVAAILCSISLSTGAFASCDARESSPTPTSRYQIHDGEVYDTKTHLTWQRCSVGQHWKGTLGCVGVIRQMSWTDAMRQAVNGWRLPTIEELKSLIATNCSEPAINEAVFPDMELYKLWYWTGTETGTSVWYVAFGTGSVHNADRTDVNAVRLVRSGP